MLEASTKAVEACRNLTKPEFLDDEMRTLAVTRLLEILGEAAKNVSPSTRERDTEIPWRAIAGARDRLIHGYHDVDLEQVWRIVTEDLPGLIPKPERHSREVDR